MLANFPFFLKLGIVFNEGPLAAEQRAFVAKHLRGFGFRSNLFEDFIRAELNQVLEDIDKTCGRPLAINGKFAVPVLNAVWNIFMGQRFEYDDPQLRQISDGVRKYDDYIEL